MNKWFNYFVQIYPRACAPLCPECYHLWKLTKYWLRNDRTAPRHNLIKFTNIFRQIQKISDFSDFFKGGNRGSKKTFFSILSNLSNSLCSLLFRMFSFVKIDQILTVKLHNCSTAYFDQIYQYFSKNWENVWIIRFFEGGVAGGQKNFFSIFFYWNPFFMPQRSF